MLQLKEILPHFDGKKSKLAEALQITKQAVSSWDEDGFIPEAQELKLRYEILPGVFCNRAVTAVYVFFFAQKC